MVTFDICMPLLGETVEEATITSWLVEPGHDVIEGEPLFEVSTDKVDSEVPAPISGTLAEIVADAMATVPVGAVVARVERVGDETATPDTLVDPEPVGVVEHQTAGEPVAADRDVDPVAEQVPDALNGGGSPVRVGPHRYPPLPQRRAPAANTEGGAPANPASPSGQLTSIEPTSAGRFVPYTPIRRTIGSRMTMSQRTAAQTLVVMEADYETVYRARRKAARLTPPTAGLTYLPFVLHAVIDAVRDFPLVNAHVSDEGLHVYDEVHLGIAVDLDHEGLVVPVLRRAHDLRLPALARVAAELADAARGGKLGPDDYAGGTITVTNPGGAGTVLGAPIINPPQAAIVESDGVTQQVVPVGEEMDVIGVRRRGYLSMTYDHRAFDGAYASAFLRQVCEVIADRDWEQDLTS